MRRLAIFVTCAGILISGTAQAQVSRPRAGLATTFGNIDKRTGKTEKMAGGKFFCLGRKVDQKTVGVAHRWLPCGTMVLLVNIRNGRTVRAPVIDRGPYWAVPRSCSHSALGRFPGHACWKRGRAIVKARLVSRQMVFANIVDVTVPVARRLRLRGKEPVLLYVLPRGRYNW